MFLLLFSRIMYFILENINLLMIIVSYSMINVSGLSFSQQKHAIHLPSILKTVHASRYMILIIAKITTGPLCPLGLVIVSLFHLWGPLMHDTRDSLRNFFYFIVWSWCKQWFNECHTLHNMYYHITLWIFVREMSKLIVKIVCFR